MTEWIVQHDVAYEGITEYHLPSAQSVVEFLADYKTWDDLTIIPQPLSSYCQSEFLEAFAKGLVT